MPLIYALSLTSQNYPGFPRVIPPRSIPASCYRTRGFHTAKTLCEIPVDNFVKAQYDGSNGGNRESER